MQERAKMFSQSLGRQNFKNKTGHAPAAAPGNDAKKDATLAAAPDPDTGGFDKMSQAHQYMLMEEAGIKPGPNVSLALAIDKFRREKVREVLLHLLLMLIFSSSSLLQRDVRQAHQFATTVRQTILSRPFPSNRYELTFLNISTDNDVWGYLTNVIPYYIYEDEDELSVILTTNSIVQAPRLRQVRVNSLPQQDCLVVPRLKEYVKECYPAFKTSAVNKSNITGWPPGTTLEYKTGSELNTAWYGAGVKEYEGGGFAIDIPLNYTRAQTIELLEHLKANKWTDRQTRAVFFDFVLYNSVERFFLSVRLVFEFLPYGRVSPFHSFRVMRLGIVTLRDRVTVGLDLLTYAIVLFYMYQDVRKMQFLGVARYLRRSWHWVNWMTYAIFWVMLGLKLRFLIMSFEWLAGDGSTDALKANFDFEAHGWTYSQIYNWTAFNTIFVWLRAFSYFKYTGEGMAHLTFAVQAASHVLVYLFFFFALLLFAFATAMFMSLGTDVESFNTLYSSYLELCFIQMRNFKGKFDEIKQVNDVLGPLLIIAYQVLCVYGLSRMFISVLSKNYAEMQDYGVDDPMAVEFRMMLKRQVLRSRSRIGDFIFCRKFDEARNFRLERDRENEAIEERDNKPMKKRKKKVAGLDPNLVRSMMKHLAVLSEGVTVLTSRVDLLYKRFVAVGLLPEEEVLEDEEARKARVDRLLRTPTPLMSWQAASQREVLLGNKTTLPPRWRLLTSTEGVPFYYNTVTKVSQWDPPLVSSAIEPPDDSKKHGKSPEASSKSSRL